jgi:hypothetical protein
MPRIRKNIFIDFQTVAFHSFFCLALVSGWQHADAKIEVDELLSFKFKR